MGLYDPRTSPGGGGPSAASRLNAARRRMTATAVATSAAAVAAAAAARRVGPPRAPSSSARDDAGLHLRGSVGAGFCVPSALWNRVARVSPEYDRDADPGSKCSECAHGVWGQKREPHIGFLLRTLENAHVSCSPLMSRVSPMWQSLGMGWESDVWSFLVFGSWIHWCSGQFGFRCPPRSSAGRRHMRSMPAAINALPKRSSLPTRSWSRIVNSNASPRSYSLKS